MASVNTELKGLLTAMGGTASDADSNSEVINKITTAFSGATAFPELPDENGTYSLKVTVTSEGATLSWVADQL